MIDHLSLHSSDSARAIAFYEKALAPLGYKVLMRFGDSAGMGEPPKPDFWISPGAATPTHIAFRAANHEAVDAFYQAAMEAGAKDNGAPGPRPQYHPGYYGAFVLDPDGNNVEAVIHDWRG